MKKTGFRRVASAVALVVAGCAVCAVAGSPAPAGAEWPGWRGPKRDGVALETGLLKTWQGAPPKLLFTASGVGAGFSSVSLSNGRIFTMGDLGSDQFVFALDQKDGRILWKARVGNAWNDEFPGPRGTPTIDGDLLYAIGTDGDLVCLETATGKERWRKSLPRDYGGFMMSIWKFSESPLIDGPKLVFTPGGPDAGLVAVDKKSGKDLWRAKIPDIGSKGKDGAAYSSIVVSEGAGVRQYVQLMGRGVVSVRSADGKFLWGYNRIANNVANIPTPIVRGDYVFTSTGYQTGAALLKLAKDGDGVSASEVYFLEPKVLQNHHGGLVLIGDYVYGGHAHNRGFPICVQFLTGKVAWGGDIRNDGKGSAAVVAADGNLIFRYQDGLVMLIEATPSGYKEKGSFQLPGVTKPSWPHPVVLDGKLYLREQDNLYVYNVRG